MNEASEILGCKINTEADIINSVTESLIKSKETALHDINEKKKIIVDLCVQRDSLKERYIAMKEQYKNIPKEERPETYEQCKKEYYNIIGRITFAEKTVETLNANILQIDCKIKNISDRLCDSEANTCPICMDNIKHPYAVVTCCKNKFCIGCIGNNIKVKSACPLCRCKLSYDNLIIVEEEKKCEDVKEHDIVLYEKLDIVSDYLLLNPTKKILIFSEYEKTFDIIQQRLQQLAIKYSSISGNSNQILKTIDLYKKGDINVLMLNAKYFGAGINLQMTDEVFVYHRMSGDLEKQVVGRAQRLGRKEPLCINYLCYENEYDNNQYNENVSN
jgi:SNF2 family DNA or RNA helicase